MIEIIKDILIIILCIVTVPIMLIGIGVFGWVSVLKDNIDELINDIRLFFYAKKNNL